MNYFQQLSETLDKIPEDKVGQLYDLLSNHTGQVFVCGNGGSAATASHFAADLGNNSDLRVMSFDSVPALTMYANDYGYEEIFWRQVLRYYSYGKDIAVLVTTSGNSLNMRFPDYLYIRGGLYIVALTGFNGGKIADWVDLHINIPSNTIEIVEDCHIAILHSVVRRFKDAN